MGTKGALWLGFSVATAAAAAVISAGCGSSPAESEAGQLAYSLRSQLGGIVLVNDDGTGHKWLTRVRGRMGVIPPTETAEWSPTGSKIVFVTGDFGGQLWTINADGTEPKMFAKSAAWSWAWSPDGREVAAGTVSAVADRDGRFEDRLSIFAADGEPKASFRLGDVSAPGVSTPSAALVWESSLLAWSPDGRFIAIGSAAEWEGSVQVVDLDRGTVESLTPRGIDMLTPPVWSPDSRWIAVIRIRWVGDRTRADLWLERPDGSEHSVLIENARAQYGEENPPCVLAWTPDGKGLIFQLNDSLYRRSFADGKVERVLAEPSNVCVDYEKPVVLARGKSLWLKSYYDGPNRKGSFLVLDGAGRFVRRVESGTGLGLLSVSPDAKRLVGERNGLLTVTRVDGSDEQKLSADPAEEYSLTWSADGSWLAFTRSTQTAGEGRNFVMRADGRGVHQVGPGESPQLAPDGKAALVSSPHAIRLVNLRDGLNRIIARGDVRDPTWSPDGRTIAFVRDHGFQEYSDTYTVTGSKLYTIRRDGSDLQLVSRTKFSFCGSGSDAYYDDSDWCYSQFGRPTWLANGKSLLVSEYSERGFGGRLRRVDLAGVGATMDLGDGVPWPAVVFTPDGSRAAFHSEKGIESINLEDGKRTTLVEGVADWDGAAWSPDGTKLAYIAGGLHVVNRDGSDDRVVSKDSENVRSLAWRPSLTRTMGQHP